MIAIATIGSAQVMTLFVVVDLIVDLDEFLEGGANRARRDAIARQVEQMGLPLDLTTIAVEQLPEIMRDMTPEERQTHVEAMGTKRAEIQARVAEVNAKRQAFVTEELKKHALDESRSFDKVLRDAIRAQAVAKGFQFQESE